MQRDVFFCAILLLLFHTQAFSQTSIPANNDTLPTGDETVPAGNEKVAEIFRTFKGRGVMRDESVPTPPDKMVQQLHPREGVDVDLVAAEPTLSQPLFLTWDSRGRMWVVQYRQYQYPAGLKVVRFDQHLRAVFDKVPEPPPLGAPGADRITVFEDSDGDGHYDSHKDVLTGLNIATSVQVGPRGIWVLNPPYLLHYPDVDGDDIPDGDPEVHLSGFGLQDTHSVANSLMFGPDGWLYGANGSTTGGTVSSKVTRGVRFEGQCIWRYHPDTQVFEIYAEGGGNTFSLDIDSKGRVFSGTNGGNRRGYYYPQGSYADKNWGKHGPLTNPYAFGYFGCMQSEGDTRRFAQAFCIYEGGLFPTEYDETIVAPNSLHNLVWNSERIAQGSTYRTVDRDNLLDSDDRWFRPVYGGVGPDGAIYIADWYDTRLSHVSPVDDWHKESGRVYRLRPTGTTPNYVHGDLRKLPSGELIAKFSAANKWVRQRAMLELGWRGDESVMPKLVGMVNEQASLEALWAIHLMGKLDRGLAVGWLTHSDAHIRRWVIRLLGDRREQNVIELVSAAKSEKETQVRSQLASTSKRIDAATGLSVINQLLRGDTDAKDPHLPLLYWWGIEGHADNWPAVESFLSDNSLWRVALFRDQILGRLMQRYASSGKPDDLKHCEQLVAMSPDRGSRETLLRGLNKAFQGRSIPPLPDDLNAALAEYQRSRGTAGAVLGLRRGTEGAAAEAIRVMRSRTTDLGVRIELARAFSEIKHVTAIDPLIRLAIARDTSEPALQRVALSSLASYSDDRIATSLVGALYSKISNEHELRATACRTLASRKPWAARLLREINEWRLKKEDVPADVVQRLRTFAEPEIVNAVDQAFGKPVAISSAVKREEIHRLSTQLQGPGGDADSGKIHFDKICGNCHKLFGEGKNIGPPLDGYERANLKFWLNAIVEPSLEIREGYQTYAALTNDGRVVTGVVTDQNPVTVTLKTADQKIVIPRADLEEFRAVKTSLMPETLLQPLNDQQLRDLFAYLRLGTR
ncbi:MAG: PVC-type heme-binding CxxCH protein [Planctomycetota bacterium]